MPLGMRRMFTAALERSYPCLRQKIKWQVGEPLPIDHGLEKAAQSSQPIHRHFKLREGKVIYAVEAPVPKAAIRLGRGSAVTTTA